MQGEESQVRASRCELLLTDTRDRDIIYAATSAHGLMTEAEMNYLDTGRLETHSIQQTLDEMTRRYRGGQLRGELGHASAIQVPLTARPKLGYHIHRHNRHNFMNNIALLPFEADALEEIETTVPLVNYCPFNGILAIRMSIEVDNMIGYIVNARGRRARVVPERWSSHEWGFGYYLSFQLEDG